MSDSTELALPDKALTGLPERFQPRNLTELMSWAKLVHSSNLAPKGMNEAGVVLCVQMGAELNITPTQALQNIAIINGRPSIFGDLGLALFRRDAAYKSFEEDAPDKALKQGFGRCKIVMKDGRVIERTFSIEEAKAARLWGKEGPWSNYPGRQMMFRARWWAMRDADPGVFKGIAPKEEMEDIVDVTHAEGTRITAPARKSDAEASGVSPDDVQKFVQEMKSPGGNGGGTVAAEAKPAVDRSKLVRVLVKNAVEKTANNRTFYVLTCETSSGGAIEPSTFSSTDYQTAVGLKGRFALVGLKDVTRGEKTYKNLTHIEAAPDEAGTPPPPDDLPPEPGMGG